MMDRRSLFTRAAGALALAPAVRAQISAGGPPPIDIERVPDLIALRSGGRVTELKRTGNQWQEKDVHVTTEPGPDGLRVKVYAPTTGLEHILIRWHGRLASDARFLGDHWERSYGDLEWRASVPNRVMPWYFLMSTRQLTCGYGVKTGGAAIAFWQADPAGISLWLDLRNGAGAVHAGERVIEAATIVATGQAGQSPFDAAKALCRRLCEHPRLPAAPVYGSNNWYYTYGQNFGYAEILHDSELLAEFTPAGEQNRPFMLIDMGWSRADEGAGPVTETSAVFPDMPGLATKMKAVGVRPGIWTRPLLTVEKLSESWRLPGSAGRMKPPYFIIDPSVPEALDHVRASVETIRKWGFEMIKHDYSTYDILGRWGFEMGTLLTPAGWQFHDKSRTSAEIILDLYRALRSGAGNAMLIGCNTIGHLGAGLFELQRIGDDTSGRDWERTRKMGVNTLAFRLPQHNTFFAADADCVPVTPGVPWMLTEQWLDLVARSGTPLFVSADPKSVGEAQKAAIRKAFAYAARPQPAAEPLNWMESTTPDKWRFGRQNASYNWYPPTGASPFAG